MKLDFQAVIIGAGPAGLASAVELVQAGIRTAVIDDQARPGGQIFRQSPGRFGPYKNGYKPTKKGATLLARFKELRVGMEVFQPALVYAASPKRNLNLCRGETTFELTFEKLIICEGASERVVPFPGWTLPGVMTLGGLQRFLKEQRLLAGRKIVLSGSGPLLYLAGAQLARAGAEISALCEAAPLSDGLRFAPALLGQAHLFGQAARALLGLLRSGVAINWSQAVVSARGEDRVAEVCLARLDRTGAPRAGTEHRLAVDAVGLNHGFAPPNRLTRLLGLELEYCPERRHWQAKRDALLRSSRPEIYVAGDGGAIGGAEAARLEGRLAGLHALSELTGQPDDRAAAVARLQTRMARLQRYTRALFRCFGPRLGLYQAVADETVICRCEGVTSGQIKAALAEGAASLAELKGWRPAMGPCQGRTCEANLIEMLIAQGFEPGQVAPLHIRPPLFPLPLTALEEQD